VRLYRRLNRAGGNRPRATTIQLALVLGAAVALLGGVAGAGASTASAPGKSHAHRGRRLILSPRSGKGVPARPVKIRVHSGRKPRTFRAQLNHHPIARYFSRPSHHGVRRLEASLSYGLRRGHNRLHVRVGKRTETSRFRVWRGRPLVGAGVDRAVAAGDKVYIEGKLRGGGKKRSAVTQASTARSGSSRIRWSVSAPPGAPPTAPGDANRRRTFIRTTVPGRYQLKLTATANDGRKGSDTLNIEADPTPAVPVDTITTHLDNGHVQYGIQVGGHFYAATDPDHAYAQLVALNRKTLTPVSGPLANKSYICQSPQGCSSADDELKADLSQLDSNDLVIVSNPLAYHASSFYPSEFWALLKRIGVSDTGFAHYGGSLPRGAISAIGVPGMDPGQGAWHAVIGGGRGAGRMRDYLVRDNEGNYVFAPSDRIDFSTQAAGSGAHTNVMRIGDRSFSADVGSDEGGFQVVVADSQTLAGTSRWFPTNEDCVRLIKDLRAMFDMLKGAYDAGDKLVFVASRGNPDTRLCDQSAEQQTVNQDLRELANQTERLGGTRGAFFKALDPGLYKDYSYTLVGSSRAGEGKGVESLGTDTTRDRGALNTAPITGRLDRTGPNYTFEAEDAHVPSATSGRDPSRAASELAKLAFQPPTRWPEQGNAGRVAAIAWVGKQVFGTDDPRGQYWTVPFINGQFDYGYWSDAASRIRKLTYAQTSSFSADDLAWAKGELQREIGWLISTHRYLDALSTAFGKTQLQSWADLKQISNSIRDLVDVSPDAQTFATNRAVFDFARSMIADILPAAGQSAAFAANDIYDLVTTLAEVNGKPAVDRFQSRADEVGVKLADRMAAAQGTLSHQLPNTIAADYGKLRTVGACASSDPSDWSSCPFEHNDWQFTQDDQSNAAKALRAATKVWAYGALLPARYNAYKLPLWWRRKVNDNNEFFGLTVAGRFSPFAGLPDSAQMAKPIYRNIPTYDHSIDVRNGQWTTHGETWEITALGYLKQGDGTAFNPWVMGYPDAKAIDPLFNPVSQGGLGIDAETFFDRSFPNRVTDLHYPERDTPTGWCAGPAGWRVDCHLFERPAEAGTAAGSP
jgi:hypothetical protein